MRLLSFDVGTKHLALCDITVEDASFCIHNWSVESCLPSAINVNTTSINDIVPHFAAFVNDNVRKWTHTSDGSLLPIEVVYIENQPMSQRGARNLKTKVLSHILQGFLLVQNPQLKILFINPSLKLKEMPREGKSSYAQNKKYAVSKTLEYIQSSLCTGNIDVFKNQKKKDDLADAFLQGLYAGRLKIMPEEVQIVPSKITKKRKISSPLIINE